MNGRGGRSGRGVQENRTGGRSPWVRVELGSCVGGFWGGPAGRGGGDVEDVGEESGGVEVREGHGDGCSGKRWRYRNIHAGGNCAEFLESELLDTMQPVLSLILTLEQFVTRSDYNCP